MIFNLLYKKIYENTFKNFEKKIFFTTENEEQKIYVMSDKNSKIEHVIVHEEPNILYELLIIDLNNDKEVEFALSFFKIFAKEIDFKTLIDNIKKNIDLFEITKKIGKFDKTIYFQRLTNSKIKLGFSFINTKIDTNIYCDSEICKNDILETMNQLQYLGINFENFEVYFQNPKYYSKDEKIPLRTIQEYYTYKQNFATDSSMFGKHKKFDINLGVKYKNGLEDFNVTFFIKKQNRGLINEIDNFLSAPEILFLNNNTTNTMFSWKKLYDLYYEHKESTAAINQLYIPISVNLERIFKLFNCLYSVYDDKEYIYFDIHIKMCKNNNIYCLKNQLTIEQSI